MGSSHSDEGKSGLRSKTLSTQASKSSIKSTIKEAKERVNRLEKWRKVFQDIVSSEKFQENKFWNKIVADLLHFTKRATTDKEMEWMKDPQFGSLASFTQYCLSSAEREGEIQMVGLDEQSVLEIPPMMTSFKNNTEIDPTSVCDQRTNMMKNSAMSVQFGQASNIFSSFQERPSIIPELRRVLLNQIEEPNHVIQGLVTTFKHTCEKLFANLVMTLDAKNYTKEHEELLTSISGCCKKIIDILVKFLGWIYKEPLEQFEHSLDQENLSITYLIEDIIYELLFKGPNSRLYTLAFHLLSIKYRSEQQKFKEILAQKKKDALSSYDEVFVTSKDFLLEPSTAPYNEAINKIKGLRTMTNPYTKYDITMAIEDEMWSCICQHYKDDAQVLAELRHSFGMDFRLPIFTYCIVQSQSEDLVIHRRFIEEFIDSHILDHSFGFTVFKSSLDFLLQDRPSCSRKLSDDVQILSIAMTSKRNSLK